MTADNLEEGLDAIVAEFVLGTLTGEERDAFEARLATSSSLQALVAEWENRLSGIYDLVPESEPPPAQWSRIDDTLGDAPGTGAQATELQDDGLIDALKRGIRMCRQCDGYRCGNRRTGGIYRARRHSAQRRGHAIARLRDSAARTSHQ